MKKLAILPIAALMLAACSESPMGVDTAQFSKGKDPQGNAFHNLTQPVLTAGSTASSINLSWTPSLADVQAQCNTLATANPLNDLDECRGVHFELYRNGEKLGDVSTNQYIDTDVLPGIEYTYYVKSKGLEQLPGSKQAAYTYHSPRSNEVTASLAVAACGAPIVTSSITGDFDHLDPTLAYDKDNTTAMVTLAGNTENLYGCPGAIAEYRIVARMQNNDSVNPDEAFTMPDWAPLTVASDGSYTVDVSIRRNNKNVYFQFLVRVSHEGGSANAPTPVVTIVD